MTGPNGHNQNGDHRPRNTRRKNAGEQEARSDVSPRAGGKASPNSASDNSSAADRAQHGQSQHDRAVQTVMNACLDEVLGHVAPPDLSEKILARMAGSRSSAATAINGRARQPHAGNGKAASVRANIEVERSSSPAEPPKHSKRAIFTAIAACAACLALGYLTFLNWESLFSNPGDDRNIAGHSAEGQSPASAKDDDAKDDDAKDIDAGSGKADSQQGGIRRQPNNQSVPAGGSPEDRGATGLANAAGAGNRAAQPGARDEESFAPTVVAPLPVTEVVNRIDASVESRWREEGVTPSSLATDAEWCRRVFLDVLGRIPTVQESVAYITSRSADKREQLVQDLLYGSQYRQEFADNWATVWTNVLIGREGGLDQNDIVSRDGLHTYLASAFEQNEPYDWMVTDLITATGANRPEAPGFNGAVNFLLDNMDNNATSATTKTAQVFLARQVQCAQCHNHPFDEGPQRQFWEMNSFFRQARVANNGAAGQARMNGRPRGRIARLVDRDFRGEGNRRNPDEAEIYYEQANGILVMAFPAFLDGTVVNPSGRLADINRRQALAELITQSPWMSEAIVNRMWGHFLGHGFTRAVDDLGPHQSISHPDVLQSLAGQFRTQGHDLRRLMEWIVLSRPYALSSQAKDETALLDRPLAESGPLFSRFYARQLSPEAVFDSLRVAAGRLGAEQQAERDRRLWLGQFTIELENDENREVNLFDGAIPQSLEMWNGELTRQALTLADQGMLASIAASEMSNIDKVKHLFLAAVSREPHANETRLIQKMLRDAGENGVPQVLQDVYWALLNSSEFILQH